MFFFGLVPLYEYEPLKQRNLIVLTIKCILTLSVFSFVMTDMIEYKACFLSLRKFNIVLKKVSTCRSLREEGQSPV